MKIFLVDDSLLIRERIRAQLAVNPDFEIIGEAVDQPGAIADIQRLRPDVVILDIRLPGGSGIHVLEAVKGLPNPPHVIMLTAFPYPQYRQKCLEMGADYFLDKTSEFDKLPEVLKSLQNRQAANT